MTIKQRVAFLSRMKRFCIAFLFVPCPLLFSQESRILYQNGKHKEATTFLQEENIVLNSAWATLLARSFIHASYRNHFLTKELHYCSLSAGWHLKGNLLFSGLQHDGYAPFGRLQINAGYGRQFGHRVGISMRFYYDIEHAYRYPSRHSFTFDIACATRLNDKISAGFVAYNPARLKYGFTGTVIPTLLRINGYYTLNKKICIAWGLQQQLPGKFDVDVGVCYAYSLLCLSWVSAFTYTECAVRLSVKAWCVGMFARYTYRLGFVPECKISYAFGHEK